MTCKKRIEFKKPQICSGDLKHLITVQHRVSTGNSNLNSNSTKSFTTIGTFFAAIKTTPVGRFFDDVALQDGVTTDFFIRYTTLIDLLKPIWVEFGGRRFKIVAVENINEENRIIRFRATDRGSNLKEASKV